MAVSRSKMLGHYTRGPGGYRCSCCRDPGTTRWRKHAERQELAAELAAFRSSVDLADGPREREAHLAEAEGWPGWDFSDCRHGCNGDPPCPERCNFTCHPAPG